MNSESVVYKIELIGGPLDGIVTDWPAFEKQQKFKYYGGFATYQLESNNEKAVYKCG